MRHQIGNATFTAEGTLAFLKSWEPVLSNPTAQIAQESPTGYKEAYDLGYQLRTRFVYPTLPFLEPQLIGRQQISPTI